MKQISLTLTLFCVIYAVNTEITKHHDYEQMIHVMKDVASECPDITYLYNLTGNGMKNTSVEGRELAVIVISDNPGEHELCKHFICDFFSRTRTLVNHNDKY